MARRFATMKDNVTPADANVYTALAAAQLEFGAVQKGSTNPAFKTKYADLADVAAVVIPTLARHGVATLHYPVWRDDVNCMRTEFMHGASGTRVWCDVPLLVDRQNMQGYKSATTYAKRIGLESLSGVAPEDDDGNAAAASVREAPKSEGLLDAWKDAVLDALPADATAAQKAQAFTEALEQSFAKYKTAKGLSAEWDRRRGIIKGLEDRFPDLHARVVDAFELRMQELTPRETIPA